MGLIPSHGDSRGNTLLVLSAIFWTLAALAVASRIWARRLKKLPFVLNDYAIFAAMVFGTALAGVIISDVLRGAFGLPAKNATQDELIWFAKVLFIGQFLWAFANLAIKISILHLYIEIFWTKPVRIVCYTVMGFAACLCVLITVLAILLCRPIAYNWDKTISGTCGNGNESFLAQAIINLCIDIAIVIIPIPVLWDLQMRTFRKFGVYFMFSVGIGILVITACRISAIHLLDPMDMTYTAFTFGIYNLLETLLGIFNACLPVTRPVFQKVYNTDFFVWTRGSKESKPSSGGDSQKQWIWGLPKSRSTAHGSDKKKFQQLDEQFYPLSTMGTRNETSVGSWAGGNLGSTDLEAQSTDMDIIEPNDAIRVTRNWDIKSSANAQKR